MSKPTVEDLTYLVLPGRMHAAVRYSSLYDQAYDFWAKTWNATLGQVAPGTEVNPDDFYRQDRIALLLDGAKIVGLHCYTFFDVSHQATRRHSFISKYFSEPAIKELVARRTPYVMSMEFLAVDPAWRASQVGVSLIGVFGGLAMRLAEEEGLDAVIAAARADIGVAKVCYELGAVPLAQGLPVHGIATDVVVFDFDRIQKVSDQRVNDLIDHFWARRVMLNPAAGTTLRSVA